jgi:dihydrofolate synthase/folylpolyglutamate synthase
MDYNEAIEYINALGSLGSKPGLERVKALAKRLGNPQEKLKVVHITGTNGKGSTAMFISSILECAGYTTGLYTSPHIIRLNEVIRFNGNEISEFDFAEYVSKVKATIDEMTEEGFEHPTQFEVLTALSFLFFHEKKCDVAVIEVGMGGRADATNIISDSVVSVITKITPDHILFLGNTLTDIAYEKAGIVKPGSSVVVYPQEEEVLEIIKNTAGTVGAKVFCVEPSALTEIELKRGQLSFNHPLFGSLKTSVVGIHQAYNVATALKTIEVMNELGFVIPRRAIKEGLLKAKWPGRFELLQTNPDFYIDGGHNPDAIRSFVETYKRIYPGRKANIIMGVMKDKEYETMVCELSAITKRFIAVTPDNPRALSAAKLAEVMLRYCNDVKFDVTIKEAVGELLSSVTKDEVIVAIGSLYYIGQIRKMFENNTFQ